MNIVEQLQQTFFSFLTQHFSLQPAIIQKCSFIINADPAKQQFGDLNTNTALILAKHLKRKPTDIAQEIAQQFSHEIIEHIEIAGPGFLNFFLKMDAFQLIAQQLLEQKKSFFKTSDLEPKKYCIEFVSANPTGPLHFGHGRGGIIGDVLGNILRFLGHNVNQEFYINDAGRQIKKLGESFKTRCQQFVGMDVSLPEDAYHGQYLIDLAKEFMAQRGKQRLDQPQEFFENYAKKKLLEQIKKTLSMYGIAFDTWFSEKTLHETNAIEKALEYLEKKGHLYEKDGAIWFKSTAFVDDKDRVVRKASGDLTYVSADVAYMQNKIERGFNHLIMILGHDHHSYAIRLQGVKKALGFEQYPLDIVLYQLVKMKENGQVVRLSKRAGRIITLNDVIETVGTDVARFFYLNRKADAQLEFDLELALKKTDENPVYYIQYAYVRTGSILQKVDSVEQLKNIDSKDAHYIGQEERFLLKKIIALKELLTGIGNNHQTHLLAYYVVELAQVFSSYYAKNRVIDPDNISRSRGRLLITVLVRNTLALCFNVLGISQPEHM